MNKLQKELKELEIINKSRLQAYDKVKEQLREYWILDYEVEIIINKLIEKDKKSYKDAIESAKYLWGKENV